jgi:hypothetical protein
LSAYELSGSQSEYYVLVEKAEEVAQQMAYAFTGVGNFRLSRLGESDLHAIHRILRSRIPLSTLPTKHPSTKW